jgi:hypothetical protein
MGHTRYSGEKIGRRGQEIYDQTLRPHVETEENIGKITSIDIETGDYEVDDHLIRALGSTVGQAPGRPSLWRTDRLRRRVCDRRLARKKREVIQGRVVGLGARVNLPFRQRPDRGRIVLTDRERTPIFAQPALP